MTVRWGVVGPGRIADKVVADAPHVPGAEFVAVASRSTERAEAFARRHGIPRVHTGYRAVVDDPDIDVLYIATPHPQHRAVALAALRAGKGVLVEKAFTVTPAATREIADVARSTGSFAMEAMWTRFQPAVVRLRALLAESAIGEVRGLQVDLGVTAPTDPADRFYNPDIGGGAVFDLTVYPVSFAQMVLGTPDTVDARGVLGPTGVDVEEAVLLGWADGRTAEVFCSLRCPSPGSARIYGTRGWIEVPPRFHHPSALVLHRAGAEPETIAALATGDGYCHELIEVTECVAAGRTESAVMPLADTVAVQDVLGQVTDQLGVEVREGPVDLAG